MIWTFQRPHGDPFDDFYAGETAQPCLTYPDPEHPGQNLDTPNGRVYAKVGTITGMPQH